MKRIPRILTFALLLAFQFTTLCACGSGETQTQVGSTSAVTDSGTTETDAQETDTQESDTQEPDADEVYTIDLVSTFSSGNVNYEVCKILSEKTAEVTDGRLQFNLLGGSEIFSGSAGAEAVMSGALDAVFTAADYICGYIPAASAICATNMTNAEMTASGGMEYLNELMADSSIRCLFVVDEVGISGTKIFTNDVIESLDDLVGLNIRTSGTVQVDILNALGCTATPLGLSDVFPGLEQGLIEGYVGPAYLGSGEGFFEYVKCVIDAEIARGGSSLYINTAVWDGIPEEVRAMFEESVEEINAAMVELYVEYVDNNEAAIVEAGGQVVELSAEVQETIAQVNEEYGWKSVESMVDSETYETLRELFIK